MSSQHNQATSSIVDADILQAARTLWAVHARGLFTPPLSHEDVKRLEQLLGAEGMRQAMEEDPE